MPYSMYAPERIVTNDVSFSYSYSIISGSWEITWNIPEKYINPNPPSPPPSQLTRGYPCLFSSFLQKCAMLILADLHETNQSKQWVFLFKGTVASSSMGTQNNQKPDFFKFNFLFHPFTIFNRTITVIYLPSLPVNNSQSCQTRTNPASYILYPL